LTLKPKGDIKNNNEEFILAQKFLTKNVYCKDAKFTLNRRHVKSENYPSNNVRG